jgi:hypothetical protein
LAVFEAEIAMGSASRIVITNGKLQIRLSDNDAQRVQTFLEDRVSNLPVTVLKPKVFIRVNGYKNVASYTRAMPGQANLAKTLGKDFFEGAAVLLSVGFQVYDDWSRDDLDGAQKLGRASLALLGGAVPPLGLIMLGAALVWPEQSDRITKLMFSDQNPAVNALANLILQVAGPSFEQSSLKPSWVDFF